MKEVLITGVNGFTGGFMVAWLKKEFPQTRLIGLGRSKETLVPVDDYICADLNNIKSLQSSLSRIRAPHIIHLASAMPPVDDNSMWKVNVAGTISLLRILIETDGFRPERVLLVGSAAEYCNGGSEAITESSSKGGNTAYGQSKWAQFCVTKEMCQRRDIPFAHARTFNLVGPGLSENVLPGRLSRIFASDEDEVHSIGNMESKRDYLDIRDAVAAYGILLSNQNATGAFNVCSGITHSVRDLIQIFEKVTGKKPNIQSDQRRFRKNDLDCVVGSPDKLKMATGWEPAISMEESFVSMLSFLTK